MCLLGKALKKSATDNISLGTAVQRVPQANEVKMLQM